MIADVITIPREFSRSIYQDGKDALADPEHPCHPMVRWQQTQHGGPFHLPEPFSGAATELNLLFVGLNPSISGNEFIPTDGGDWPFERYDDFYRTRFSDGYRIHGRLVVYDRDSDGGPSVHTRPVKLWNTIERLGPVLSGASDFRLGTHALLTEIVHFKSTGGWLGASDRERRALLDHQMRRTAALLEAIAPCVLVPMGNAALAQLFSLLELRDHIAPIGRLIGQSFRAVVRGGATVSVVPVNHLSYGMNRAHRSTVASALSCEIEHVRHLRGER